jgi:hypothetical protein
MATQVDLGKIRPVWKGDWAASTAYERNDMVREGVNSYICVTAHTSGSTFNDANWHVLAYGSDIPEQAGNAGFALKTDGTNLSWGLAGGVIEFDSAQSGEQDGWSIGNGFYPATRYAVSVTTTSSTDIVKLDARMSWSCSDTDEEVGFSWAISTDGSNWSRLTSQGVIGNNSGLPSTYGTTTGQHNGGTNNTLMGGAYGVMDVIYVPGSIGTFYFCPAIDGNSNTSSTMYNNRFAANNAGETWDRRGSSCVTATLISGGVRA